MTLTLARLLVKAKFGMACSLAIMLVMVLNIDPETNSLPVPPAGPYGFRGPLLGLVLAFTMMIMLVKPRIKSGMEQASCWMLKAIGASAAALGGWQWLAVETEGNPAPYLSVVAAAIIVVGVGAGLGMLGGLVSGWWSKLRGEARRWN